MNVRTIIAGGAVAAAAALGLGGVAQAHDHAVTASCDGIHVALTNYSAEPTNTNTVTITVDGTVQVAQSFGTTFTWDWASPDMTTAHTYRVAVLATQFPNGTFDTGEQTIAACMPATTTTVASTGGGATTTTTTTTTTMPPTTMPATTIAAETTTTMAATTTAPTTTIPESTTTTTTLLAGSGGAVPTTVVGAAGPTGALPATGRSNTPVLVLGALAVLLGATMVIAAGTARARR